MCIYMRGYGGMNINIRHVGVAKAVKSVIAVRAEFDAKYNSTEASSAGSEKDEFQI